MEITLLFKLTFILVFGLLLVSFRRVPAPFLLLTAGFLLGYLNRYTGYSFTFPIEFLRPLALLSLIAVVFSVFSRLNIHSLDHHAKETAKHSFLFLLIALIALPLAYYYIFGELAGSLILPFLLVPVSLRRFFARDKNPTSKVLDLLKNEERIMSAFAILPLVLIGVMFKESALSAIGYPLLGISAGLVMGILFLRFRTDSRLLPVLVIGGSVLAYFLAYSMNGSGVLAVASFAFLYTNLHIKNKQPVKKFVDNIADTFSIIALTVLGIIVFAKLNYEIIIISLGFFLLLLLLRFVSVLFTNLKYSEKMYMTLNCSHGKVVGVILFAIIILKNPLMMPVKIATLVIFMSGITTMLSDLVKLPGVKRCR